MENISVKKLWSSFKKTYPDAPAQYHICAFENAIETKDQLAQRVLEGIKTVSSHVQELQQGTNQIFPNNGDFAVLLNGKQEAVGIIQIMKKNVFPFNEVTEEIALEEGEGDCTITSWKEIHEPIFRKELAMLKKPFQPQTNIVSTFFELVFAV